MLRRVLLLVVLGLVAVGAVTWVQRSQRADERQHGGDVVTVHASVTTPSAQRFPTVLAQLGGPAGEVAPRGAQPVVARVSWDGTPSAGGTYAFVLLDGRAAPPAPLRGYGAWWRNDPAGAQGTGPHGDGRYDVLGEHYGWLAGTRPVRTGAGWTDRAEALGVPATEHGEATLAYYLGAADLPAGSPADQVELALVFVDVDGEVRWARRVPLHAA